VAIQSFKSRVVEDFFANQTLTRPVGWALIQGIVIRKLDILHYARSLRDLNAPGNRLKALKGRMRGLHAIRINDQWRITFHWTPNGPADVDIVDYH
jgi:proteic killer suppression protein